MELIATARFRRAAERALAAGRYSDQLGQFVRRFNSAGVFQDFELWNGRSTVRNIRLLMLTANRGLCGGYNTSIVRLAAAHWQRLQASGVGLQMEISGKRGISAMRFRGLPAAATFTHFDDRPKWQDVEVLADRYLQEFVDGQLDRLEVIYMRFDSLSRQTPAVETLLPLREVWGEGRNGTQESKREEIQYDYYPGPGELAKVLLPAAFRARLYKCFCDAGASEQIARMVSMRAATENAETMLGQLNMMYNRARQTQITSELLEVLSAAEALARQF